MEQSDTSFVYAHGAHPNMPRRPQSHLPAYLEHNQSSFNMNHHHLASMSTPLSSSVDDHGSDIAGAGPSSSAPSLVSSREQGDAAEEADVPTPKQHPCGTCRKRFARRSDLARHERIHTNDRPHVCDTCHKKFIQRSALTVHIRVHTGEKPHVCDACNKAFSDSSSLARHRRIHSGRRPYKCQHRDCQKTFTRRTTLTRHISQHHNGPPSLRNSPRSRASTSSESLPTPVPQFVSSVQPAIHQATDLFIGNDTSRDSLPATNSFCHLSPPACAPSANSFGTTNIASPAVSAPSNNLYTGMAEPLSVSAPSNLYGSSASPLGSAPADLYGGMVSQPTSATSMSFSSLSSPAVSAPLHSFGSFASSSMSAPSSQFAGLASTGGFSSSHPYSSLTASSTYTPPFQGSRMPRPSYSHPIQNLSQWSGMDTSTWATTPRDMSGWPSSWYNRFT